MKYTLIAHLYAPSWKRTITGFVNYFVENAISFKCIHEYEYYDYEKDGPFIYVTTAVTDWKYRKYLSDHGKGIFKLDIEGIYIVKTLEKEIYYKTPVVVNSEFEKREAELSGIKVAKVIPHILPKSFQPNERLGKYYREKFKDYVLWVSQLPPWDWKANERKGFPEFIEAMRMVLERYPKLKVIIITSYEKDELANILWRESKVKMIDKAYVIKIGIPTSELIGLYSGARLFVCSSRCEGFGFPVLEAMRCRCPVVYINGHAVKEFAVGFPVPVEYDTYVRFSTCYGPIKFHMFFYDPKDLAEMIIYALTEKKEVIEDIVEEAYEKSMEFIEDRLVPLHLELIPQ